MSFPNQLLTIMQQDKWNVRTKQNKQAILTLQSPAEGWKTKAQIFYVMAKKNAKENGSFLRTRKHVQIESKLIQVIVKKKKKTKKERSIWSEL